MAIKFLRPTVESEETQREGVEYTVDGKDGTATVKQQEDTKKPTQANKPESVTPKSVPIPFNFPSAPETETKDALKPETEPKRRGRPPGSGQKGGGGGGNKKPQSSMNLMSVDSLSRAIRGIHEMVNIVFPGASISESNARLMAEQMRETMDVFGFNVNPKVTALVGLIGTVAVVEIPIVLSIRETRLQKLAELKAKQQAIELQNQPVEISEPYREPVVAAAQVTTLNTTSHIVEGEPLRV